MNIVMAAPEAAPWVKTGGLGDVLEALPKTLAAGDSVKVTLFLPFYKIIKTSDTFRTSHVCSFDMSFSLRRVFVGVERLLNGPEEYDVFFIDNNDYFWRDNLYGYYDDGERFAYFSKAVLSACSRLNLRPDVFHCHDWQTALIPVLLKADFWNRFYDSKTVLTIHNLQYQGWANADFINVVLGIGEEWRNTISFDGSINFLKAGIEEADAITTVSETYAKEIMTPQFGGRLSNFLLERRSKIYGIVNGINMDLFSAENCADLPVHYSAETYLDGKKESKLALQRELGLNRNAEVPILAIISRLADHKGIDVLCEAAPQLLSTLSVQLVVCGTGDRIFERSLSRLAEAYPGRFAVYIGFSPSLANRIYAGCDIYLMPSHSEPCGLSQLIAMRFGAVPVVHAVGGLKDTVPPYRSEDHSGRGFAYQNADSGSFFAAVSDACSLYHRMPEEWAALCRKNMREDFSWNKPAEEYLKIYKKLCHENSL